MASAPIPPDPPDSRAADSTVVVESQLNLVAGPLPPDSVEAAPTLTAHGDSTAANPVLPIKAPAPPGYELLAELGRGGMGVVYKARQRALNRIVALKVVLAGGHASISQRVRFLAEAEAVASLNHVGIVGVYEFGTWDEQPYMALEFCSGGTLADKLRGTPLSSREATVMAERLACAVVAAHERGIVHRDIKPANILITGDGTPKVGDFGLAKMTEGGGITMTGAVLGTPSYMAPEQARGETKTVGPAADVYALGAVLYECLTGRPPFRGASAADTIVQSLSQEPVGVRALNPAVPVDLETVCLKCLEKDPIRRYPSALALAADLQRFLDGRPVIARPVGPLGRSRRWIARNQVVTGLLVAVAVAIIAGTTTTYLKYLAEAEQKGIAVEEAQKKEEALKELRTTLGQLEALTAEQKRTLTRLTLEKAATEDALLRGLMRPLRNQQGQTISLEETRAFFDLAGLLEERLRFQFVERALASPDGSDKIAAWPQDVVGAVVGLDRAAANRLRDVVARVLKEPTTSRNAQTACAFLIGVLPPDDVEVNRLAARILGEQLATRPVTALGELSRGLQNVIPRLPPEDAAPLARTLVGRMTHETDVVALGHLENALVPLVTRLNPAEASAIAKLLVHRLTTEKSTNLLPPISGMLPALALRLSPADADVLAGELARNLIERLPTEKDSSVVSSFSTAIKALGKRLAPEAEQSLLGPVVSALSVRCVTEKDSKPITNLSIALASLATRAALSDRVTAVKALADRSESEKEAVTLSNVVNALQSLAVNLPAADIAFLVNPLLTRLATETDVSARYYLSAPLAGLIARLPPDDAAELIRRSVLPLANRIAAGKDAQTIAELSSTFFPFGRYFSSTDAESVAKLFVDRMATEKDTNALDSLAASLGAICKQLSPEKTQPLTKVLADRLKIEKDVAATKPLVSGLMHLAGRLRPPEGASLTRRIADGVVGQILTEREADNINVFAATLAILTPGINPADVATLGTTLASRMATEQDTAICIALARALAAVSDRLTPEEEAALLAGPTRKIATRLASAKEFISVNSAVTAINQLAPRLDPAEAAIVLKLIVDRMVVEREHAWHFLVDGLWDTAARLSPTDAARFSNALMERFATEKDPVVLNTLCHVLSMLAYRLDPDDAVVVARGIATRMVAEKDQKTLLQFASVFTRYTPHLSDADLHALMKSHVAFPPIRTSALLEFGRRAGQTKAAGAVAGPIAPAAIMAPAFTTVWEFLEWVERAHPELIATPAPAHGG